MKFLLLALLVQPPLGYHRASGPIPPGSKYASGNPLVVKTCRSKTPCVVKGDVWVYRRPVPQYPACPPGMVHGHGPACMPVPQ